MSLAQLTLAILLCCAQVRAESCSTHSSCLSPISLCFFGKCIAARQLPIMSSCYYDYQCRKPGQGWKNEGRGCREGRCYELISVSGTGNCDYQEQCPGQSICMEHHCVAAEPTNSNCRMQSDCGIGERCIGDTCFSPAPYLPNIGGHYRRQPRPVTSSAYDHDSYEPPLRCPDFLVCPVDCCTAGCPYAHCCCHGPSFYHH